MQNSEFRSDHEEEDETLKMTEKAVLSSCHRHKQYITPELNDILYLEKVGYSAIGGLERFVNLSVLWLNGNQITKIEGLETLINLQILYLQENFIERITGLENLKNLKQICLSSNSIRRIDGIEHCVNLVTLDLDKNRISGSNCLDCLVHCPMLQIVQLSDNKIDDPQCLNALEGLRDLRVLHLGGNAVIRAIPMYRRTIISKNKELRCLDDTPITEEEKRTVSAWASGGKEAEALERQKIQAEKTEKDKLNMKEFRRMQREAAIDAGTDIRKMPELLSSDDEDREKLMQEKYKHLRELDDGTIVQADINEVD